MNGVAAAGDATEPGDRAREVASEGPLDRRPPDRFAEESLYPRVHLTRLHRPALIGEHLRDGIDDPTLPRMSGAGRAS